jgi:hypothetical protein
MVMYHLPVVHEFERVPNQNGELFASDKLPETFVRAFHDDSFDADDDDNFFPRMPINHETLVMAKGLFAELEESYNIPVAEFHAALFKSDKPGHKLGALVVSNAVEGEVYDDDLAEKRKMPTESMEPGRVLVGNLTRYLFDKLDSGEPFLDDIFGIRQYTLINGNFMLHDVDPIIFDHAKDLEEEFGIRAAYDKLTDMAHAFLDPAEFRKWQSETRKTLKAPRQKAA